MGFSSGALQAGGPELATPDQKSGDITLKSKGEGTYKVAPGEQLKVGNSGESC